MKPPRSSLRVVAANDQVSNAPNTVLSVSSAQNAQHGTGSLDAGAGTVTFTPDAGFYGTAGFDMSNCHQKRNCLRTRIESYRAKRYSKPYANESVWSQLA
jgi:hypothetical protein